MPRSSTDRLPPAGRTSGTPVVLGLLALGVGLAVFAIAFHRRQTSGCLAVYGSDIARAIAAAPHVEVWRLAAGAAPGGLVAVGRCDVSRAPGLVHLRRGLVEDANFDWRPQGPAPLPPESWDFALAFSAAAGARPAAILVIGRGPSGAALCVVGRPGRVGLGRLEKGLRTWVQDACPAAASPRASGK